MKNALTVLLVALVAMSGCKDKNPEITKTYELSEEMMAYFVNYEVGTKWIYQDIKNISIYDTIELVSKENFDVNNGNGSLTRGFVLYYKPKKSKDFKVRIDPGANKMYFVKVDPMVTAAGAIVFENNNGTWTTGVTYYDSIDIKGTRYFKVINSQSSSDFHAFVYYGMNQGLIAFSNMNGGSNLNNFKLIQTIKP